MKLATLAFSSPALLVVACGPVETETAPEPAAMVLAQTSGELTSCHGFDGDFTGCREFAGIGRVPAVDARPVAG